MDACCARAGADRSARCRCGGPRDTGCRRAAGPLDNASYLSNPFAIEIAIRPELRWIAYLPLIVAIFIGAIALALRFRRATGESRQQLKWLAFSVAVCGLVFWAVPLAKLGAMPPGAAKLTEIVVTAAILGIPISAGVAVLRYRLWDIDRIVSRTISYLIISAMLAVMFAVTVVALQALLSPLTGQSTVSVAAATLVAFTLFQPLRRRVQTAVDRRFNRAHIDAQRVLDGFAAGLRDDTALDALNGHLETVVGRSMQPRSVAVWTVRGTARLMAPGPPITPNSSSIGFSLGLVRGTFVTGPADRSRVVLEPASAEAPPKP